MYEVTRTYKVYPFNELPEKLKDKACSGNALMIPRELCHSWLKHLFAKAEDIPQSFVTEPEGYKMILNVAEAIRDSAESKD